MTVPITVYKIVVLCKLNANFQLVSSGINKGKIEEYFCVYNRVFIEDFWGVPLG